MPYRILSLDGGGTWALLQALTLQDLYRNCKRPDGQPYTGHDILRDFDLVIANSGGSMVLAGLAENKSPAEIVELFTDRQQVTQIFSKLRFWERYWPYSLLYAFGQANRFGPRYSARRKLKGLEEVLENSGNLRLPDIPARIGHPNLSLVICGFDAQRKRATFFRSNQNSLTRSHNLVVNKGHLPTGTDKDQVTLAQAVHASSNAPVNYFDFPAELGTDKQKLFYWDGALGGFNNPVAAGVVEAIANGYSPDQLQILSIGTGAKVSTPQDQTEFAKAVDTIKKRVIRLLGGARLFDQTIVDMVKTILYEPPDWSNYIAFIMRYGGKIAANHTSPDFIRLSPLICDTADTDPQFIKDIRKLDMDVTSENGIELLRECFKLWQTDMLPNQPIQAHISGGTLICAIGQRTYPEGIAAWKHLTGKC